MSDFTFKQALDKLRQFTQDRGWGNYHKPKDMLLKLMEEVGEVAEHFQWQSNPEILESLEDSKKKAAVEEELVDVLIVLLMIMDVLDMDVQTVFERKLEKNAEKYPADQNPQQIVEEIKKGL